MFRCLILAAPLALAALPAMSAKLSVTGGTTAGTLGFGPELGVRLSETVGVRANATLLRRDLVEADSDDIESEGIARLRSGGAMLDLYPLGGGFRLSAGVRLNGNKATLRSTATTNVTIGARPATPEQDGKLRADYRMRDWAPALTLGYAGELRPQLVAGFEAGVLFHGAPHIRNMRGTLTGDRVFAADFDRERMHFENDFDDYRFYPVVNASLGYRF